MESLRDSKLDHRSSYMLQIEPLLVAVVVVVVVAVAIE